MSNVNPDEVRGLRPMPDHVKRGLYNVARGGIGLKAAYRLMWFREEHPDWGIETQAIAAEADFAFFRAVVKDETGRVLATAHKSVKATEFPNGHIEKAETGAVARALELVGYGTEFGEFDESDVSDASPQASRGRSSAPRPAPAAAPRPQAKPAPTSTGNGDAITEPQKEAIKNLCQRKSLQVGDVLQERYSTSALGALTQGQASELIRDLNQRETKAATA